MEQKNLTAENPEKAEVYIPLARKYAIVQLLAPGCIERTESGFWRENIIGQKMVYLYMLAGFYLHLIDTSGLDKTDDEGNPKPEFQFTLEDYDRLNWTDPNALGLDGQTAQHTMQDYEEMKDLLDREISARLAEKNDPFRRFQEALRLGLTPEAVQELQKAVEAASSVTADAVPPSPEGEGFGEDGQK